MLGFPERLERFAAAVTDELDRRAGDAADRPALLVVVDVSLTLPAGRREVADLLVRLAQRGRGDRVHVVVAAGSVESSAAWSRLLALLTWRVLAGALPPRETRTVLGRTLAPSDVGEGVVHLRAGSGPVARARLAPWPPPAAAEAVAREMRRVTGQAPGEAGGLPRLVTTDALPAASGNRIPIGIDEERLAPVRLDLALDPHVLVVGPPGIGRTNVLRLVLASLAGTAAAGRALVFVIDPGGALAALADGDDRIVYGGSPERVAEIVAEVRRIVRERLAAPNAPGGPGVYVVVDDHDLLGDDPLTPLHSLLGSGAELGLHLVAARRSTEGGEVPDPLVLKLHEMESPLLLMAYGHGVEEALWGAAAPERVKGRAVLVQNHRTRTVQVALAPRTR
ncbi:FtsK/SpoIIIE domain-containing protein [Actinomadura yumaensis]|uniref:FtsK/SpoIIIE domain-containing protein n=2 Tax=Actinomadura yumaensis TaxID=111807 RepID=A0ABW2CB66_9ACTN